MNETEFKQTYVATFLASYMATHYDEHCQTGHVNEPYAHQPIEDAKFCAEMAWKQMKELE
jgi:hypothetical protein